MEFDLASLDATRPVLIAGATASGKSELALRIAEQGGGVVVNADAIQVYDTWNVLTARPPAADLARAPHLLYGHVPGIQAYSAGAWLREVAPLLTAKERPIIVGGTGLYFAALCEGLANIPPTPADVRAEADAIVAHDGFEALIPELDDVTRSRIDLANPMRVQRAWEVQRSTGQGLAAWHASTPPPLLPLSAAQPILLDAPREWLNGRIAARFAQMLQAGALDEARAALPGWDPAAPASKAIGAPELIAHLQGKTTLEAAQDAATIATRQFAKRQRTWFRARMKTWEKVDPRTL